MVEAWGVDLSSCCEAAVDALLQLCIDMTSPRLAGTARLAVEPGATESLLYSLLDEVIFVMDTSPNPPIAARVSHTPGGGLDVELQLAEPDSVAQIGSAPKAISRSEFDVVESADGVTCRFLVDV